MPMWCQVANGSQVPHVPMLRYPLPSSTETETEIEHTNSETQQKQQQRQTQKQKQMNDYNGLHFFICTNYPPWWIRLWIKIAGPSPIQIIGPIVCFSPPFRWGRLFFSSFFLRFLFGSQRTCPAYNFSHFSRIQQRKVEVIRHVLQNAPHVLQIVPNVLQSVPHVLKCIGIFGQLCYAYKLAEKFYRLIVQSNPKRNFR